MKVYPQNFLVFWSYQDQQGPVLVTSPHCAKKNNTGTLLKLLAGTCWHHLVEGAKRETILSEKGLKQLDKKHERLQYLIFSVSGAIQWTCSCPCTLHFKLSDALVYLRVLGNLDGATSVIIFWERTENQTNTVRVSWKWNHAESEKRAFAPIGQKSVQEQFCYFLWLQHLNSTAPEKVPEFDLRDILW